MRLAIYAIYIPTFLTTILAIVLTFAGILGWFFEDADTRFELSIGRLLGWKLIIPVIDAVVVTVVPIVLLIVPALARRLADGHSVFSLFNPFPTIRFIFANFGTYVWSRVMVFIVITIASLIAGIIIPTGIGALTSWLILAVARFWGRLMWAFYLAQMNR